MNQRIQELAKEAGILPGVMGLNRFTYFDPEKFAELIVRECIQVIDDSTPVYSQENLQEDYCQGKLDGYQSALLEIKHHFGVEE